MVSIILVSATTGFFAKAIEWFQGSNISHAAMGLEIDGKQMVLQSAYPSGVQIIPRDQLLVGHNLVAEFEILPKLGDEVSLAMKKVGEPYSVPTLLGFLFVFLGRDLGIHINNPFFNKSAVVCSEFVVELDIDHKIPEFVGLDPADVSPTDLFNICSNGKSFKKIG